MGEGSRLGVDTFFLEEREREREREKERECISFAYCGRNVILFLCYLKKKTNILIKKTKKISIIRYTISILY